MRAPGKVTFHPTTEDKKGPGYYMDSWGRVCLRTGEPLRDKRGRR